MSEETQSPSTPQLLDLAAPRIFPIQGKRGNYKITCRRITAEDWRSYFGAIFITSRQSGKDLEKLFDIDTARLLLAGNVITAAEGYKVAGGAELSSLPNWQHLIPIEHRLVVGGLLASAKPAPSVDDDIIRPDGEAVSIAAAWSDDGAGGVQYFQSLTHVLKQPTDAQYRRYSRAVSATKILGGSRSGVTQYLGAQTVAAELYDEMIVSVEGYCVDGKPLDDVASIRREMDMHHKFMAAIQVLQPSTDVFAKLEARQDDAPKDGDDAE